MLAARLRERIASQGPISFRDFMAAALYDPELGYYARGPTIGAEGDFYTATNASLFPHAIRRFVDDAVARLGDARVVELGGGSGRLASKLARDVTLVEPSAGLAAKQREAGLAVVASLDELRPAPTVFLANEVLDALPAHRVAMTADGLREVRVDWRDGRFVEADAPLPSPLADEARRLAWLPIGAKAEVDLAARDLLASMAKAAPRAVALFLDYGGASRELYGEARPDGTARGFRAHRVTDALDAPGEQDVTCDVDFEHVAQLAGEADFDVAGLVTQGALLADLGLVEDMQAALARGDTEAYLAGKNLLLPGGMGERFQALGLSRGVSATPALAGFRRDLYPGASRR